MNARVVFAAVLLAMSTHGSSCIREGFLIPVNLDIDECYGLSAGPAGPFAPVPVVISLSSLIDASFRKNIVDARVYDIRMSTQGSYSGTVVAWVYIDGVLLMSIGGGPANSTPVPWSTFSTPHSLLGASPYLKANPAGVAVLVAAVKQLALNDSAAVTLRASGTTAGAAIPAGLSVCFQILGQVDARLNDASGAVD